MVHKCRVNIRGEEIEKSDAQRRVDERLLSRRLGALRLREPSLSELELESESESESEPELESLSESESELDDGEPDLISVYIVSEVLEVDMKGRNTYRLLRFFAGSFPLPFSRSFSFALKILFAVPLL